MLGCRLERALEVVEHGQQLVQEPLVRALGQLGVLARDALAVVVEVGGETQVGIVGRGSRLLRLLGSRLLGDGVLRDVLSLDILALGLGLEGLVGHDRVAFSSSSTTS